AEEYWRQDRLDLAYEAIKRALKVGIPPGHFYNLQRTIEAEWGARQVSTQTRIQQELTIELPENSPEWTDRLFSISIAARQKVTDSLQVVWTKPILIALFPFDDWVEFMHARYGYYSNREAYHKICLPPSAFSNPGAFRRAATHEMTHAAVHEL